MSYPINLSKKSTSLAFYHHIADPVKEEQPSLLRHRQKKRPPPKELKKQLDQRQKAAEERRTMLQEEMVQKLSVRLARVALIADRHQRQTTSSWENAQKRYTRDVDEHVRRRTEQISLRLKDLTSHNQAVQERKDAVMRERYLQKLDHIYESRNPKTLSRVFKNV
ncbi:hypothetical protein KR059_007659 [Drosophila kikkawai]|nr:hypothetical protein KR059_007659 [Drosophila kikkawai]